MENSVTTVLGDPAAPMQAPRLAAIEVLLTPFNVVVTGLVVVLSPHLQRHQHIAPGAEGAAIQQRHLGLPAGVGAAERGVVGVLRQGERRQCEVGAAPLDAQRVDPLHVLAGRIVHGLLQLPVEVLHVAARALLEGMMMLPAVCCGEHRAAARRGAKCFFLEANYEEGLKGVCEVWHVWLWVYYKGLRGLRCCV